MTDAYPKMLYREGSEVELNGGASADVLVVADEAEHEAAVADGWQGADAFFAEPVEGEADSEAGLSILDQPVKDIVAVLPELTGEELAVLLEAETNGKTRKGLITALELAIAAAKPAAPAEVDQGSVE